MPGRHGADGPGQDVIEHQGGDGNLGEKGAQSFSYDPVHAAADEQRTTLDVYPAHGVAKEHDEEDKPWRGRSNGLLDDSADVVGGAG